MQERVIERFDPTAELAKRWPQWRVVFAPISCGEVWVDEEQVVLVRTPANKEAEARAVAHVCAHLALEHTGGDNDWITPDQEEQARWLTQVWLDDSGSSCGN